MAGRLKRPDELSMEEMVRLRSRHHPDRGRIPRIDDADPAPTEQELIDGGWQRSPALPPAARAETKWREATRSVGEIVADKDRLAAKWRELRRVEADLEHVRRGGQVPGSRPAARHAELSSRIGEIRREIAEIEAD